MSAEFFLQGLEIRLHISDQEMEEILAAQEALSDHRAGRKTLDVDSLARAQDLYLPFMQAHNHELVHLLQVLCMPAFQVVWVSRTSFFSYEAAVMLRYFEQGGSYEIGHHKKLIDALLDGDFAKLADQDDEAQGIASAYDSYDDYWRAEFQGISLFHLVEGMAHYASKQLADDETEDYLGIENNPDYTVAFDYFRVYIEEEEISARLSYLLFIFLCYFSCQHFDAKGSADGLTPARRFVWLCKRAHQYLLALTELNARYERYDKGELLELRRWGITTKDVEQATEDQIRLLFAFFELLEIIDEDCNSGKGASTVNTDQLEDFRKESLNLNIDWNNKYTIARFLIFPANFVDVRILYDNVLDSNVGENEYTYADQASFWRFISNCRGLLNAQNDIPCCEKHGMVNPNQALLSCKEEGGFAYYLTELTGRRATDLFRTWRPT